MLRSSLLLLLIGFLLLACDQNSVNAEQQYEKSTLNVNGKGEIKAKADVAFINIAVETTSKNAKSAVRENAVKTDSVIKKLKSMIGKDDKVQTTNYNLSPIYEYNKASRKNFINGYRVSNEVIIETYDLKNIGNLIDATSALGANRINGPRFDISNREDYKRQALVKAVEDAKKTADVVANSAGVKVIKILQISPSYHFPVPYRGRFAASAKDTMESSAPTPIEAGNLTVTANINIVYEIE